MKLQSVNLTEGAIWQQLLRFSFPLVLSNLLQQLYSTADLMIVGNFAGDQAMAAIGATGSLGFTLIGIFMGMSVGASVLVAQAFGARDGARMHRAVHTTYAVALSSGLLLTLVGHFFSPLFLALMGTPESIFESAVLYAKIHFYGSVPLLVYNMGSGILRSVGDSERPFIFLFISTVTNILLDLLFVGYFHWGVAGAGWATFISQLIVALLVSRNLLHATDIFRLSLRDIRFHAAELRELLVIGIPAGIQNALISFSNVLIQAQVNSYGSAAVAGVSAADRYDAFLGVGLMSFQMAATTFTGQNIGAGRIDRLKRGARVAVALTAGFSLLVGGLLLLFRYPLMRIFSPVPEVVQYGVSKMTILTPLHWIFAIAMILGGILRGAGKSVVPMTVSIFALCGLRMFWIYGISPFWRDIRAVFLSYPISWFFTLLLTWLYYRRLSWLKTEYQRLYHQKEASAPPEKATPAAACAGGQESDGAAR